MTTEAAATTTTTAAADAPKPWTFTAPAKDAVAWTGATFYTDKDCATKKPDPAGMPAEAKVQVADTAAKLFVQAVSDKEIWIATTFDEKKTTYLDTEVTKRAYELADTTKGADSKCFQVQDTLWAKATIGGWAAPAAADGGAAASAKTLGAAFAAAALAVAATQF